MSDDEPQTQKQRGYRLEYASSARAKCKGPKPCQGSKIEKSALRFGSLVDFQGNKSFSWRHWGCVTPALLKNVKQMHETADDLDGYEELSVEDQAKILKAWEDGRVADEDIPDTARKPDGDKPKAAKKTKKTKDAKDDDGDDVPAAEPAPKRKRATAKKNKDAEAGSDGEEPAPKKKRVRKKKEESDGEDGSEKEKEEKPKEKKKRQPRKKKVASDDEGDGDEDVEMSPPKRKIVRRGARANKDE